VRLHVISVGRWKAGPLKAAFEEYAERLGGDLVLREVEPRRRAEGAGLRRLEGELLAAAVPPGAAVAALDPRGRTVSSEDLAERLGSWRDAGRADAAFLIGGADGLDPAVRDRADLVIALGAMTWPHLLVRVMLAEQLYRARTILAGHPYHRA